MCATAIGFGTSVRQIVHCGGCVPGSATRRVTPGRGPRAGMTNGPLPGPTAATAGRGGVRSRMKRLLAIDERPWPRSVISSL